MPAVTSRINPSILESIVASRAVARLKWEGLTEQPRPDANRRKQVCLHDLAELAVGRGTRRLQENRADAIDESLTPALRIGRFPQASYNG